MLSVVCSLNEIRLDILPDPDDPDAAQIFVEGLVGDRPYRFLLDTGAGRSTVVYDVHTAVYPLAGQSESGGLFAGRTDDLITVPSLSVGPISRTDVIVSRLPPEGKGRTGLIGMDVLGGSSWHFFFREQRALIDRPFDSTSGRVQGLQMDRKSHPYIDVQIGAVQAQAVWDTGAGVTVVDLEFIEEHIALFEAAGQSTGTDSTGASRETPMFNMAGAHLGGVEFPPHRVAGVDLSGVNASIEMPMDMILGYTTLSQADWYFDFPGRGWALLEMCSWTD